MRFFSVSTDGSSVGMLAVWKDMDADKTPDEEGIDDTDAATPFVTPVPRAADDVLAFRLGSPSRFCGVCMRTCDDETLI
jgi:hypothetical protein